MMPLWLIHANTSAVVPPEAEARMNDVVPGAVLMYSVHACDAAAGGAPRCVKLHSSGVVAVPAGSVARCTKEVPA